MDELIYNLRRLAEWTARELWENPVNFPEGVLKQAADELEKRRWIPVEERLPEDFEEVWAACKMDGCENWTIQTVYDPWLSCPWGGIPVLESGKAHVYAWMPNDPPEPPKEDEL